MQQVLTLNGMEIPTDVDSTTVTSQTIGKRRGDSTLPIEQKTESIRVELSTFGGINITFDSKEPNAKIENEQVAFLGDVFKLSGETVYTVVLDGQNKVKALEGVEKLQEKADKLDEKAKDLVRSQLEPDKLKTELRAVPWQSPGCPGPARRVLGAERDHRRRGRPDAHFPQEVRVRGNREEGGQDARQDHEQGDRDQVQHGSRPPSRRSR